MEERLYYPLTPSQQSIFLSRKYAMHKSIINIPTSIILKESLDEDLLEDALEQAIQRWDAFGIRLMKDKKQPMQYFGERRVEPIERLDFTRKSRQDMEKTFLKLAAKKLDIYEAPQGRFFIVTTPEGYGGIFSVISHLIMDSWSISMFYKDVFSIYYSLATHWPYPKEPKPYEEVLKNEIAYKETEQYQRALVFWQQEFGKEEPMYTHVNGREVLEKFRKKKGDPHLRYASSFYLRNTPGHELHWVYKEELAPMEAFAKEHGFPSLQVLFQMGIRTYLAYINEEEEDVCFYNVVARRGTLAEKMTGGTRVHFMHFRTIMHPGTTFLAGCQMLLDKQNELYRHADFSPMEMFQVENSLLPVSPGVSYRTVSMTYQPVSMHIHGGPEIETRWYSNGAVSQPLYLTIMDGDGQGGLKVYYEYMSNVITSEKIKDIHRCMLLFMTEGAKNPQITLRELFDLC